jgi:hypothetical protein
MNSIIIGALGRSVMNYNVRRSLSQNDTQIAACDRTVY